jgi:hypothetical protein
VAKPPSWAQEGFGRVTPYTNLRYEICSKLRYMPDRENFR